MYNTVTPDFLSIDPNGPTQCIAAVDITVLVSLGFNILSENESHAENRISGNKVQCYRACL